MVTSLQWAWDPSSGTGVGLTFPRPLLPRCNGPLTSRKFSSASVIQVADAAFPCPLLRLGETEETRGSSVSRRSRYLLILESFKIAVQLFIGKGHGEIKFLLELNVWRGCSLGNLKGLMVP